MGVDDNQNIVGLSRDISMLQKQSLDGFELHLIGVIKKYIGNQYSSYIKISFPAFDGLNICLVDISKSSKPVFIKYEEREDFFIRAGCSSQPLSRGEQSEYERVHWK
jgi:hypothetical protein